jgi:hypothetical protein
MLILEEEGMRVASTKALRAATARSLRHLAAALILAIGAVHLYLWFRSYRDIAVIGPLFLLNAVGALLISGGLVWKPEGIVALIGLAFAAGTLGAFAISTTAGLFGFVTGWDASAVVAAIVEALAVVVLGVWWALTRRKRGSAPLGERDEAVTEEGRQRVG